MDEERDAAAGPNYNLRALLAEVDAFQGNPTPADIRALAAKYGESTLVVEVAFEAKPSRLAAARAQRGRQARRAWLAEEDALLRRLWAEARASSADRFDERAVAALNALPANQERRTRRNIHCVRKHRVRLGLHLDRKKPPRQHAGRLHAKP